MDRLGKAVDQGIAKLDNWESLLAGSVELAGVRVVVLGDGTNRVNIEQGLSRLLPQVKIVVIDEVASTVDAWKLKRDEEAGRNIFRRFGFTMVQLFRPQPVDDYAARVLAQRYLSRSGEAGE
ncbi:hypothetical protein IIA79_00685 [bacterium]|nr:hypothetical protein [bacterium]